MEGEREFVPGDLSIGIVDSVTINEAWELVNSFDLKITDAWGHKYLSNLPNDSIDYIINYLNKKPYINDGRWKAVKNGNVYIDRNFNKISVSCRLTDVLPEIQEDWLKVVEVLKLYEVPDKYQSIYLNVPVGYELLWKDTFENEKIIRWASPNYYSEIELLWITPDHFFASSKLRWFCCKEGIFPTHFLVKNTHFPPNPGTKC